MGSRSAGRRGSGGCARCQMEMRLIVMGGVALVREQAVLHLALDVMQTMPVAIDGDDVAVRPDDYDDPSSRAAQLAQRSHGGMSRRPRKKNMAPVR